jgi:phenylacetate-CoA ligase
MRFIIGYAQEHVSYYRELFRKIGLAGPGDIQTLEDVQQIPVLTKPAIRQNLQSLTAQRDDLIEYHTGGSTGIPLTFYGNKKFILHDKPAANYRAYSHGGYRPGDGFAIVWGFDKGIPRRRAPQRFVNDHIYRHYELNSFDLSEESIRNFLSVVRRHHPPFLKGYASSLTEIARFVLREPQAPPLRFRAIFSEAERLDDIQRGLIEKAFGAPVINYYGSREFGTIAVECSAHSGLHVNFEQVYVETDPSGKVLVTSFFNLGTVFLRYEIGDCAEGFAGGPCACGRQGARITRVLGRETDNLIALDGRIVHGEYVTHLFYPTQCIDQFQLVQQSRSDFTLEIVSRDVNGARRELGEIIPRLEEKFRGKINLAVSFVDDIKRTPAGKRKFTVCNIRP